MTASVCGQHGH